MSKSAFQYKKTDYAFVATYEDGQWDEGVFQESDYISIPISSTVLHYGQSCFEGLKAYRTKDNHINLFRVKDNAIRFQNSCKGIMMPTYPVDKFIDAVKKTVLKNEKFVPKYGDLSTLYIRPFMIGVGHNVGVKPSPSYKFIIFVTPVGKYFDDSPVHMITSEIDRAAPHGTGAYKVGGNYASSLQPKEQAKLNGYKDCVFLDPKTHTKIEECGTSNFFGITKDHTYVTPTSPSILNSITNRSLKYIAKHILNLNVEERDVYIDQLDQFVEAGACGTAAIITPISSITHKAHVHTFSKSGKMGPITKKLFDTLIAIQFGELPDPDNWITTIK